MKRKDKYEKLFKKLEIPSVSYPPYEGVERFAKGIKKCSLLKPCDISYSNTTATYDNKDE